MTKKRTGLDALREYEARSGRQTQSEAQTEGSSGGAWRSGLDALRQFEANGGGRNVKNGEFNPNYRTMTRAMYESAYERYKRAAEAQERYSRAADAVGSSQVGGYLMAMQQPLRQDDRPTKQERYSRAADAVGSSPVGGYIRAMRPPVKQPNFAEKTVEHDQESGQRRTQYELRRQIDQLEKARDYALSMQAGDPEGLPELRGAYDAVNAGRTKPMTLTEMDEALREKRYRRAVMEKSVSGRLGEYAVDLGRGVFKGGFEQAMTGFESVMGYLEQGANGAAAWALRDLAKAVPDGGLKDKMLALADDFNSYYTGESMTSHEEMARLHRRELEKLEAEIADKYKGVPLWIQQQMPSLGNMLFGAGLSGAAGVNNLATLGVTAGGNSALDAKEKGASDAQALAYGVVAGGLEVFSEKLFGGNPIYDTDAGLVNKAVGKLTDNKTIMKILNSKAFDIASEGLEEVVTEVLDPVAEWAIYNGSNTEFADAESIGNAFLGGVFLSVVGNVADAPNQIRQARYERVLRTAGSELADIAQTVDSAPVQEAAQVIRDKIAYGVTPDAADIGAVLDAIDQAGETVDVEQVREAVTAEEGAAETAQREANFQAYSRYAEERDARARAAEEEVSQVRAQEYTEAINDAEADAADAAFEKLNKAEVSGALDAQARWQAEDARAERQFEVESREDTDRALSEAAQRYGYDERMTSVLLSGYSGAQSTQQYAEAVNAAYEYGKSGMSRTAAQRAAQGIDKALADEAWSAGKEIANGEKAGAARIDDGGKRNAGMDSGKQAGAVAGSAGGTAARSAAGRAVAERIGLENRVSAAGQPYLSGKDIGLSKGSAQRSFREAPESTWTDGMKAAAGTLKSAGFADVHFTVGTIGIENQRAKVTRSVDGVAMGDTVWINATAKKWSVQQLADHEAFHRQVQDAPGLLDSVRAVLADELGDSGIRELAQRYAEAYEGCYDGEELDAYIEEICADAYAGMDRFPEEKAKIIQKAAQRAQETQQEAEENDGTRGPPEKYSVDKRFSADVAEWYREGMPEGESFTLGSTGETMQGLGAIESDIYMNGDKISTILKEHPEMTIREIQKIPELLDDPILILKSKGAGKGGNSRLVLFGSINTQDGQPVLAVLDLRPKENGFVLSDMQKVNSAYAKENPASFVSQSDVLFADKKRTVPLLRRFGLTVTSRGLLRDGSIGSISYRGNGVNISGEKFSSVVQIADQAMNAKFSADDTTATPQENDKAALAYESMTMDSIPKKAQDYLRRVRGQTAAAIQQTLSMPFAARQEVLKPAIEGMMNEYLQTGRISQETVDRSFEESYRRGVEMDTEFYDEYKDVKTRLRDLKVTLSETDRADIADFNDFRRAAFGRLRIADEGGLPVDVAYKEMQQMAPELFPASVTHPADQLMQMFEVSKRIERVQRSLDEFHGEEAEEFKRWAKNDYEASVENMLGSLRVARRYAEARMRQKQARAVPTTLDEVTALHTELKKLRRTYERTAAKNLLTAEDNNVLNRLLRGDLAPEDVQGMENAKGILAMYEAKADYDATAAKIAGWNRYQKAQRLATADAALKNADQAKDKAAGIQYSRETMTRNVRDIFPEADAKIINRTYFEPVRTDSANANKLKNQLREQVKALDLRRKARKGDAVSEAHAVQLLGEAQDNIRYLEQHPRAQDRDGKTLNEWRQIVLDLWATSPGLDRAKIENAVETFRKIYDGLFEQMNDVRIRNGYEPINYRQGYFPHFQPGTTDGILGLMGKALGIDAEVSALPTTISGLTHTFKPGITYFGNALERIGFDTAYDAVEGFDKYVEGAASVVCYTDVIQNLRALAQQVRYRTSDEGLRERVDDIRARDDLTEHQKELEIKEIMDKGRFSLSNFAIELDEYTNLLANKKSKYDRGIESLAGRKVYNLLKSWENRVAANMVAVNPASWLTNFGVITQAGAQLKTTSVLKAMGQTLKGWTKDDGFVERSDFLVNRRGSDPLVRTWQQSASAVLSKPMDWIDTFSADTIVRARYMENIARGMSEEEAMREADDFAANVMADRSKGAMPTMFESRNPIFKMFTQFQLEVNNTFSYLFKDLPRDMRKKGMFALAYALFKFLIGGYIYNEVYEHFIGRRPMLDPLGIVNDTVGDLTGYELNNLVDAAMGGGLIKESEPEGAVGTIMNLAKNVGQEAPFVGNLLGGGKLPYASSFPNVGNVMRAIGSETATDEEKLAKVGKEFINPAAYWLLPFGGGQVKKMWQGISALKRQGSYTADGRLQYPIYTDREGDKANAAWRTMLFGKSATPEAQAWVEAGFGALSEKATQTYEAMRAGGVDQRDSYELIKAMSKIKKTDDATAKELKMQMLLSFDIEDSGKVLYYYNMMASDKEKAQIDKLLEAGADVGEYLRYIQAAAGVTGEKDADGKTISGSVKDETLQLIDGIDLTPEQKTALAADSYTMTGFEPWTENHDRLYKAVSTGKDLRSTLKELEKAGYEPKEIRAAITEMFREEYLAADKAGKARLKGYLRNAFMACGLSKKEAENKIKKWEEAQK